MTGQGTRWFIAFALISAQICSYFRCGVDALPATGCTPACQNEGQCEIDTLGRHYCSCPQPTPLAPNYFLGPTCETPATLCADTSSFYCAHHATCVEVVQGENYTCANCSAAWGGAHCQLAGVSCGQGRNGSVYCFNGGYCTGATDQGEPQCECPRAYRGSATCEVPTLSGAPSPLSQIYSAVTGRTGPKVPVEIVAILGSLGAIVVIGLIAVVALFWGRWRKKEVFIRYPDEQDDAVFLQNDDEGHHGSETL